MWFLVHLPDQHLPYLDRVAGRVESKLLTKSEENTVE